MSEILDEFEDDIELTDREIFMDIWTKPRRVFKFIHKNEYDKHIIKLLILAGITNAFDNISSKSWGDEMSLLGIVALAIIVGGLIGWISYYIYASLISWTGRWLKGTQDTKALIRIFAYSMFPSICGLSLLAIQLLYFKDDIFFSDDFIIDNLNSLDGIVFWGLGIAQLVLGIWSLVLLTIGISEIQKFPIWKAIINLILPIFVIIIPFILLFVFLDFFQ